MDAERENIPKECIDSFRKKIKIRSKKVEHNTHKRQIDKLIGKIKENSNYEYEVKEEKAKIVINEEIVNKLKLNNLVSELESDQLQKIDEFGKEILEEKNTWFDAEEFYYRRKLERIKSKVIENRIDKHMARYCDSINLIGHLARILPKPTDPPEEIWARLLKPINELDNFQNKIDLKKERKYLQKF